MDSEVTRRSLIRTSRNENANTKNITNLFFFLISFRLTLFEETRYILVPMLFYVNIVANRCLGGFEVSTFTQGKRELFTDLPSSLPSLCGFTYVYVIT